jgi:hypothetical protein
MSLENFTKKIEESTKVIALDFDGVIHDDSKGFFNGTIYGYPIEGTEFALKYLSERYELVIFSCKSNPERPLIENKSGTELIWDWLEKWDFKKYISDVVWGKPLATVYIDDKGLRFSNWPQTLKDLNSIRYE